MLLYVGPDQLIPLSGFLGTVFGLALIFWGKIVIGIRRVASYFGMKSSDPKTDE
jgi:hypothetical protein